MSVSVIKEPHNPLFDYSKFTQGHRINKCALKLLGLESSNLTDEEILEFLSEYVEPSSIQALIHDSYNSFYVLFLTNIESTCFLVGKILQAGPYQVRFFPLLDFFVIKNVYLSITNSVLRDVFGTFGNVFEVTNHHVLPNSSKFKHVLSGKREISFLLTGEESEVVIPVNVISPPYSFHVKKLCSACLTEGHSILNCMDKEDVDSVPLILKCSGNETNNNEQLLIKTESELPTEDHKEVSLDTICANNKTLYVGTSSHQNEGTLQREVIESAVIEDSLVIESPEKLGNKRKFEKEIKRKSKDFEPAIKKRNSVLVSSELNMDDGADVSKVSLQLSLETENCIKKTKGILSPASLVRLLQIDGRSSNNIISYVLDLTSNVKAVLDQLTNLHIQILKDIKDFDSFDNRFKKKLLTLISILTKYSK